MMPFVLGAVQTMYAMVYQFFHDITTMVQMAHFHFHTTSQFRIPNSEYRIPKFALRISEFGNRNGEVYVVWASGNS